MWTQGRKSGLIPNLSVKNWVKTLLVENQFGPIIYAFKYKYSDFLAFYISADQKIGCIIPKNNVDRNPNGQF